MRRASDIALPCQIASMTEARPLVYPLFDSLGMVALHVGNFKAAFQLYKHKQVARTSLIKGIATSLVAVVL